MTYREKPCKGCEERTAMPNCHTNCIAYRVWLDKKQEIAQKRREYLRDYYEEARRNR